MSESTIPHSKTCTKCGIEKSLDGYYVTPGYADGHHTWCKDCHRAYYRERYKRDPSLFRARVADYSKRKPEKIKEIQRRSYEKQKEVPEKTMARHAVRTAILQGILPKVGDCKCAACGSTAQIYHHWSYQKEHWLDVIPLCETCHRRLHTGNLSIEIPVPT